MLIKKYIFIITNILLTILFFFFFTNCLYLSKKDSYIFNKLSDRTIDINFFGMHTKKDCDDIRFKYWRLWDADVFWPELEIKKNEWKFDKLDNYVKIAEKKGYEIILTLGQSPFWAANNSFLKSPYGERVKPTAPYDLNLWKNYIKIVGTRYKGKIKYYEIWNEPDVWLFYNGSIKKMVELTKVAYEILKEIDHKNKIISPSITGWKGWPGGLWWLEIYLYLGGGKYCDIIGFHFYNGDWTPPEIIFTHLKTLYSILKNHNLENKLVWNTESGFHLKRKFSKLSEAYLARMHIINFYFGINKVFWYAMDNHQFGWLYDFSKNEIKSSGIAYLELQKWLIGKRIVTLKKENGIYIAELDTKEKIVWKKRGTKKIRIPKNWNIEKVWELNGKIKNLREYIDNKENFTVTEKPLLLF